MQKNKRESIDGFIPRRTTGASDANHGGIQRDHAAAGLVSPAEREAGTMPMSQQGEGLKRAEIDKVLGSIDSAPEPGGKKGRKSRTSRKELKHPRRRKIIKRTIIAIAVILICVVGYVAVKALIASGNVFKGSVLDLVSSQPLQQDANGRSNILVFGTSEDDDGHEAPYLTDSLMVVSVDQNKNTAAMFSLPRDLWVDYDGKACSAGYQGRINALYECYSNQGQDETAGTDALRKKIGEVTGLDIQYYAHVNYSVVRDAVAAVGGITVEIEGDGADGIMDSNFDWKCGATYAEKIKNCPPNGHFIEYDNGPAELDAEHALYLAMARGAHEPTYGLAGSNYSREANQRKIAIALKEKALSAGTLTDISKVSALIDAFGDNLRTNFQKSELRTLVRLGQDVKTENIQSISLIDAEPTLFGSEVIDGASVQVPASGTYDYSGISSYLAKQLSSDEATKEGATIVVYNGSSTNGAAQTLVDELSKTGLNAVVGGNAPEGTYSKYEIYMVDTSMTATKAKLEKKFGVTATTTEAPISTGDADVIVIIGD